MEALKNSGISAKYSAPKGSMIGAGDQLATAAAHVDGCRWPASPTYYRVSFHTACVAHDQCYRSKRSRLNCDVSFRSDMQSACRGVYGAAATKNGCITVSHIYYNAVRKYGKSHYAGSGNRS